MVDAERESVQVKECMGLFWVGDFVDYSLRILDKLRVGSGAVASLRAFLAGRKFGGEEGWVWIVGDLFGAGMVWLLGIRVRTETDVMCGG